MFSTFDKLAMTSLGLVALYLLLANSREANNILTGFASSSSQILKTLQAR